MVVARIKIFCALKYLKKKVITYKALSAKS